MTKKTWMAATASTIALTAALLAADTARAVPVVYTATLTGAAEVPSNASPATGFTIVTIDTDANTLRVQVSFAGLQGTSTVAHIHCCTANPFALGETAGVATTTPSFPGFPTGVSSGTYDTTFDLTLASTYRAAFITDNGGTTAGAEAALAAGIAAGRAYMNVHSSVFPGGEIRGFLAEVPAPATIALLGAALVGLGVARRRATA